MSSQAPLPSVLVLAIRLPRLKGFFKACLGKLRCELLLFWPYPILACGSVTLSRKVDYGLF